MICNWLICNAIIITIFRVKTDNLISFNHSSTGVPERLDPRLTCRCIRVKVDGKSVDNKSIICSMPWTHNPWRLVSPSHHGSIHHFHHPEHQPEPPSSPRPSANPEPFPPAYLMGKARLKRLLLSTSTITVAQKLTSSIVYYTFIYDIPLYFSPQYIKFFVTNLQVVPVPVVCDPGGYGHGHFFPKTCGFWPGYDPDDPC